MSIIDTDIRRLALQLMPLCLRKPLLGAMVWALTKPAVVQKKDLMDYRSVVNEEMRRNGQTCNLRRVLNDSFDPKMRGIDVIEAEHTTGITLAMRDDATTMTTPLTVNSRGYGGSTELDFAVRLPQRLKGIVDERMLNSIVRRYKLAGMRFCIEYV